MKAIMHKFSDTLAKAIWYYAGLYFLVGLLSVYGWNALSNHFQIGFDATDNVLAGRRSGLEIQQDCETSIQYLTTANGGLTPRLDGQGQIMAAISCPAQ